MRASSSGGCSARKPAIWPRTNACSSSQPCARRVASRRYSSAASLLLDGRDTYAEFLLGVVELSDRVVEAWLVDSGEAELRPGALERRSEILGGRVRLLVVCAAERAAVVPRTVAVGLRQEPQRCEARHVLTGLAGELRRLARAVAQEPPLGPHLPEALGELGPLVVERAEILKVLSWRAAGRRETCPGRLERHGKHRAHVLVDARRVVGVQ